MKRIIEGIQHFQDVVFPKRKALFQRLASEQHPETLIVACSDSRISTDLITQADPGDMFVCRNAGNIVPTYGQGEAVSASIEYALTKLPIKDIVICGHSDCGAMKGLLRPQALKEMPHVRKWLAQSEGAYRALQSDGVDTRSPEALALITKLNIRLQLEHLRAYPQVFARIRRGSLRLHGWFYRIEAGEVETWSSAEEGWTPLTADTPVTVARAAGAGEVLHA